MENEIWKVESIKSGSSDDLFEAIITAQDGTKLIAQVSFMKTAQEIVDIHNQLLPPHEWVCSWCDCDFGEKHSKKCEVRKIIHEGREAAQHARAADECPRGGLHVYKWDGTLPTDEMIECEKCGHRR